jgi:hypothetical protein
MKRFVWILLGSLMLAPPGLALKPSPEASPTDLRRGALADELGEFVRQAVDGGLLEPVGESTRDQGTEPEPTPKAGPAVLEPPTSHWEKIDCSRPYPLDFEAFSSLSNYRDIYAFREETGAGDEGHPRSRAGLTLARAYLSLDLASEAAAIVNSGKDQDVVALHHLAKLLDGRGPQPVDYFAELAGCYPEARLWLGLSMLANHDTTGADLIEASLTDFRKLPLQLRDRAALMAIPELAGAGKGGLAQLLLASFSEEEVASSSQLRFAKAIIQLQTGSPDAEQLIERSLMDGRFQAAALSAVIRRGQPLSPSAREILIEDMTKRIELAQAGSDLKNDLRFVLEEMSNGSMYAPMLKLSDLPVMQSAEARAELTRYFVETLKRDLASEQSLRNLAAIEVMIQNPAALNEATERDALYESAKIIALRLGFGTLADSLATTAVGGEAIAEQRALLAYRQKQTDVVFVLAQSYPENQKIGVTAALAAIDTRSKAKLASLEPRLKLTPETILTLIEQDAATESWIVSDSVFRAAAQLTDEDQKRRVARVLDLKRTVESEVEGGRINMSSIPARLGASRETLDQISGRMP